MKYTVEKSLVDFDFWGGAVENAKMFSLEELEQIGDVLDELYNGNLTETQINDLMWFQPEDLAEMIGLTYDVENDRIIREDD